MYMCSVLLKRSLNAMAKFIVASTYYCVQYRYCNIRDVMYYTVTGPYYWAVCRYDCTVLAILVCLQAPSHGYSAVQVVRV